MHRLNQLFQKIFSFSKTEANGTVILIAFIVFFLFAPSLYKIFFGVTYKGFEEDQIILDSLVAKFNFDTPSNESPEIILKPFNPNMATVEELNALGVPIFLSKRIENYRNAGGSFKVKSDLTSIYDFPDSLFQQLKPFIQLPDKLQPTVAGDKEVSKAVNRNAMAKVVNTRPRYDEVAFIVDINKADSLEFQKLYGIGPGYARRLVSFREALGGYHSVDQVRDLYGMTDSLFYQVKSFLHVGDTVTLESISINIATFKQLNAHPYISYELTKEILAAKSKYGKFKQLQDLNRLTLIDSVTIAKLGPYLKF